jgi:hypothetical protein
MHGGGPNLTPGAIIPKDYREEVFISDFFYILLCFFE